MINNYLLPLSQSPSLPSLSAHSQLVEENEIRCVNSSRWSGMIHGRGCCFSTLCVCFLAIIGFLVRLKLNLLCLTLLLIKQRLCSAIVKEKFYSDWQQNSKIEWKYHLAMYCLEWWWSFQLWPQMWRLTISWNCLNLDFAKLFLTLLDSMLISSFVVWCDCRPSPSD